MRPHRKPGPAANLFDVSSGLSWSETTVKASSSRHKTFRRPKTALVNGDAAGAIGAPSLEELASRTFLAFADHATIDTLSGIPLKGVGDRLWERIEQSNLTTPTLFAAFCRAFPDEETFSYYRASEIVPQKPFDEYLALLTSQDPHWLTGLTLSKLDLSRLQTLQLAQLTNLVALDIYTAPGEQDIVDDYLVRSWARQAKETFAFSRLQVLILRNQSKVSRAVLEHLSAFPALRLFGVKGCGLTVGDEDEARSVGWTTMDEHGLIAAVQRDIAASSTWDGALKACIQRSVAPAPATQGDNPPPKTLPLLNFRLGPTSNDVLFLSHFAPLVFFRLLRAPPLLGSSVVPPTHNTFTATISSLTVSSASASSPSFTPTITDAASEPDTDINSNSDPDMVANAPPVLADKPRRPLSTHPHPQKRKIKSSAKRNVDDLLAEFDLGDVEVKRLNSRSH